MLQWSSSMSRKMGKPHAVSLLLLRGREIGAAEFKARCLEIMDEVERLGSALTITKHRKPVARLVPFVCGSRKFSGSLKGAILHEDTDLTSPIDVQWTADEPNAA